MDREQAWVSLTEKLGPHQNLNLSPEKKPRNKTRKQNEPLRALLPCTNLSCYHQGPVVRRPISANPGLNFNPGFFSFCSKAFSRTVSSLLFRASNHQIVGKKNKTEFAPQAFIPEIKFRTNPGLT